MSLQIGHNINSTTYYIYLLFKKNINKSLILIIET